MMWAIPSKIKGLTMPKKIRPTTPGQRGLILPSNHELTRKDPNKKALVKPTKKLLVSKKRTNGRNNHGHITCRHRGEATRDTIDWWTLKETKKIYLQRSHLLSTIQTDRRI